MEEEKKVNKLTAHSNPLHAGQVWLVKMPKPFLDERPDIVKSSEFLLKTRYFILFKVSSQYAWGFPLTSSAPKSKYDLVVNNRDVGVSTWDDREVSTIHCGQPQRLDTTRFMSTQSFMTTTVSDKTLKQMISIFIGSILDKDYCEQEAYNILETAIEYNKRANDISIENPKPEIRNSSGAFYCKYNRDEDSEYHQTYKWLNGLPLDYKFVELEDDNEYYDRVTNPDNFEVEDESDKELFTSAVENTKFGLDDLIKIKYGSDTSNF